MDAIRTGDIAKVNVLLEHGADPLFRNINHLHSSLRIVSSAASTACSRADAESSGTCDRAKSVCNRLDVDFEPSEFGSVVF